MRYALLFSLSIICLTTGAVLSFDHISVTGLIVARTDSMSQPLADTLPTPEVTTPATPIAADYARFAEADRAWRAIHARQYTLAELRTRGDGKRSERDLVRDRVFEYMRSNQRRRAIAELEQWVSVHRADRELLLSLARLLTEEGRRDDAVRRYRQLLAIRTGQ